jgi:transposase
MHRMGEDTFERLDVIPAQFRVLVVRRPKYGCRACEGAVIQVSAAPRLIEGVILRRRVLVSACGAPEIDELGDEVGEAACGLIVRH